MTGTFTHQEYRSVLRAGHAAGYRFASFSEVESSREGGQRLCFLRHDCDSALPAAVRMAAIEAEEGVASTYFVMLRSALYNVLAPTNARLVREILAKGHFLGLHFDENVVATQPDERIPALVERERRLLGEEFGAAVEAVSFHQPGGRILENRIRLACRNTYDREDMAGVHYTSDSNLAFRGGHPVALFREAMHRRLQVLIHPEWWTAEATPLDAKWDGMLRDNFELMQESLLEREDTFNRRRRIEIGPA
jgi:peptidoglycan/xylan/chitin deacetylase (PgdA/CDA1 family)